MIKSVICLVCGCEVFRIPGPVWRLDPLQWQGKANGLQNARDLGEQLLRGKAEVLLGDPGEGRIAVMQDDYYWLEVTSCPPPMGLITAERVRGVV